MEFKLHDKVQHPGGTFEGTSLLPLVRQLAGSEGGKDAGGVVARACTGGFIFHIYGQSFFTPAKAEGLRPEIVPQKIAHTVGARLSVPQPPQEEVPPCGHYPSTAGREGG